MVDEARLRQVLVNLVGNAVKFTDSGYVALSVTCPATEQEQSRRDIVIRVRDSGIGIPEEQRQRIFQPFEQTEGQDHGRYGGTGLGLSISLRLVELMGGVIHAEPNPEGRGSTFVIRLPRLAVASSLPPQADETLVSRGIAFEKATVLIVDDVAMNRRLLRELLDGCGLGFLEAEDGQQGLEMLTEQGVDLVLTDIKMPRMTGDQLLEAARAREASAAIPFVAVTASAMEHDIIRFRSVFQAVLRKPVSRGELFEVLARHLPHRVTEVAATESVPVSEEGACRDPRGLLAALQDLVADLEILRKTVQVNRLKAMAQRLASLAATYGSSRLEAQARELEAALAAFNIGRIRAALDQVTAFLGELQGGVAQNETEDP